MLVRSHKARKMWPPLKIATCWRRDGNVGSFTHDLTELQVLG